jgi:hypothetical protein
MFMTSPGLDRQASCLLPHLRIEAGKFGRMFFSSFPKEKLLTQIEIGFEEQAIIQ